MHALITLYRRNDSRLHSFTASNCIASHVEHYSFNFCNTRSKIEKELKNYTLKEFQQPIYIIYNVHFQQIIKWRVSRKIVSKSASNILNIFNTHTRIAAISPRARRNSPKLAAGPENCGKARAQGRAQEGAYDSGVEWFTALPANRKYRWTRHARAGDRGLRPRGHKLASSKASGPRIVVERWTLFPGSLFLARVPDLRSSIGPNAAGLGIYIYI